MCQLIKPHGVLYCRGAGIVVHSPLSPQASNRFLSWIGTGAKKSALGLLPDSGHKLVDTIDTTMMKL